MTTVNLNDIGSSWKDIVSELSLEIGVSYNIQNATPYPIELMESVSEPGSSDSGHAIISTSPWVVTVKAGSSLYVRNQNNDPNKLGRVVVTETTSIAGPYVNNTGVNGDYPLFTQDIDNNNRSSLNTLFGEKITGERIPSVAAQFQYGITSDGATTDLQNGGTAATTNSLLSISTGTNTAGSAMIQTTNYLRYIPGHEAYIFFTGVFATPKADSYQRVGLYDGTDGFYIGYEGTDFCVTRKRNGVATNQIINVNNVFPSQHDTFDPTKGNIYKISFGYLGFAPINFEVMTPCGCWGSIYKFEYPNTSVVTHITQTNLPARAEVGNTGNDTDIVFSSGSFEFGIVDGGGADPSARYFAGGVPETAVTAGTTCLAIFRNKATFGGIENRVLAQLLLASAYTELNKGALFYLLRSPTITNTPTWADVNTTDSTFEVSLDATVNPATGVNILPWALAKVDSFFEDVTPFNVQLRPGEYAAVMIQTSGAGEVGVQARWKELF